MNCNDVRENLIELLTDGPADPQVTTHLSQCGACTEELASMRKTMAVLDEWEAPEPSPYFLTRLRAHVKEEREKAPALMFGWLRRPILAAAPAAGRCSTRRGTSSRRSRRAGRRISTTASR